MGQSNELDLGGLVLVAKDFKRGAQAPGQSGNSGQNVAVGSSLTLDRELHLGKNILLDTASGSVLTLPAATGSGDVWKIFVTVAVTTNSHIIKVGNTSDAMLGAVSFVTGAAASGDVGDAISATDDTLTMSATTTGGLLGTWFEITDIAANKWFVKGVNVCSGVAADISSSGVN